MKQQLLESREVLIKNLELKISQLKKQRQELLYDNDQNSIKSAQHVNIGQYLKQQQAPVQKLCNAPKIPLPKTQNDVFDCAKVNSSKIDLMRQQRQTKEKLEKLKDLYEKKRELESIGIYQSNSNKINSIYGNRDMKKKIDKKILENKKKDELKKEKDKIVKEQLEKVEKFLKESKQKKKNSTVQLQNHYCKLFREKKDLSIYEQLIKKFVLSLSEKEKLLDLTYQLLKNQINKVEKSKLKTFLLSNPQFCDIFFISKNEIMRDLQVHPTQNPNQFTYQQYYEMIKSIQITNKALYPNMNFQIKQKCKKKPQIQENKMKSNEFQHQKEMQKYLKSLYVYFDTKSEKIIEREKFEIALKKGLIFDQKKYNFIKKSQINEFGEQLKKKREKVSTLDYYKTLDMKYIGLQQIIEEYRKSLAKEEVHIDKRESQQDSKQQTQQEEINQAYFKEQQEEQYIAEPLPNQNLEDKDFNQYGWGKQDQLEEKFKDLKQLDKYYSDIRYKYGNEIAWNGIQRYKEDFTKFNQCIKQLNQDHVKKQNF